MYLIKLGGSVITKKSVKTTFRSSVMDELSKQLSEAKKDFILVHGAGSFGHILAKKYDLNNGMKDKKNQFGFAETLTSVQQLNNNVLSSLQKYNISAISLPPHSILTLNDHNIETIRYDFFKAYIDNGFIPVTYGDVALDKKLGFSICSGDLLMLLLAKRFRPDKVIFVIDEDGLYTKNPKKYDDARLVKYIHSEEIDAMQTSLDDHADVTKGMKGKLKTIKKISSLNINVILVNGLVTDRLYQVLTNQSTVQTVIKR